MNGGTATCVPPAAEPAADREADADARLATLALERLTDDELERVHLQLFFEDEAPPDEASGSLPYRALSMLASRLARARRAAADAHAEVRAARALIALRERVRRRYATLAGCGERDLAFVLETFARVAGRGIHPDELRRWAARMREGPLDRDEVLRSVRSAAEEEREAAQRPKDVASCWIMGTSRSIGPEDWRRRELVLARDAPYPPSDPPGRTHARGAGVPLVRETLAERPRVLVTAIASLYRGGAFIDAFMENVCSQTIFRDACELIVVDAASPEGEADTIRRWMADFPNVRYLRTPERIGIYEAWNLGLREARGEFVTNTNLDDLRRRDSFELQAAALLSLPEADVVYQDVHYALQPRLPFERVAAFGFTSRVPRVTPAVMLAFNPPHNAPMWRRRLHDELGPFDTRYRSAGDYEFWLRCVAAGKVFHRIDEPLSVYYQNPEGISTRADTPGHRETREISARYAASLLCAAVEGRRGATASAEASGA